MKKAAELEVVLTAQYGGTWTAKVVTPAGDKAASCIHRHRSRKAARACGRKMLNMVIKRRLSTY